MLDSVKKIVRSKALLAIAFAGSILTSQPAAQSQSKSEMSSSVIKQIANDAEQTREQRAYNLLQLASTYLDGVDSSVIEAQLNPAGRKPHRRFSIDHRMLVGWAERMSTEGSTPFLPRNLDTTEGSKFRARSAKNRGLAATALKEATKQVDLISDDFAKLNMYFIAARLFQKMGDTAEAQRCDAVLEKAIHSCEVATLADEVQLKAVSSILDSMSYAIIPVRIPELNNAFEQRPLVKSFSDEDFKKAEEIRLRAVTMVDRLNAKSDVRRRVHRDQTLWYMKLGKPELAQKEKQILFDLVGRNDDGLLYPQAGACGQLVWWQKQLESKPVVMCGMG